MEGFEKRFENYLHFLAGQRHIKQEQDKPLPGGYPNMYEIYILRDKNTPTDFVISVICDFFHKSNAEAVKIISLINREGKAICATYTKEAAETKIMQVLGRSQAEGHQLKCIMKKSMNDAFKKS